MKKELSMFQNKHWELRLVFSYSIRFDNENTKTLRARCAHIKMAPTGPTHTHSHSPLLSILLHGVGDLNVFVGSSLLYSFLYELRD